MKIVGYITTGIIISLAQFFNVNAQIIEADPEYPTQEEPADITFHVNRCGCNLEGYTGDIYAHTGVTTPSGHWQYVLTDWNTNLEKAKLEKIDDTTYVLHITPDIETYYEVAGGTEILGLDFVFRNTNGSQQTADLTYPVFEEGLTVILNYPNGNIVVENEDTINVQAEVAVIGSANPDSVTLYVDDAVVWVSYTDTLMHNIIVDNTGKHWIKVTAENDTYSSSDSVFYFVRNEILTADLPEGVRDGINYIDTSTVTLVLHAPYKDNVLVIGDFNNWELDNNYLMNRTADEERYWLTIQDLTKGEEYAFQYLIDGNLRIAEPYTEKVLDPNNDPGIPESTYPDLKEYPYGKTTGLVSVFKTNDANYEWTITDFDPPAITDLVIYELHIQNFTTEGNFQGLTDTIDYLESLGINAIELMPVNEFEGNQSWGYNPSFYFAIDKMYGHKNDFKEFVDAAHARGIAVIIDLVFNHSYGQSPLVQMYWNNELGRPAANNPWYNETHNFENTSAHWGYDFNHESTATQNFVDSVNSYWMSEFHIDGFRFDFTKGFSNTQWIGQDNWASAYDADRIAILKRMADEVWERNSDAIVIFEHLAENSEETELSNYGILLWGNMNYDYNEATMGYSSNLNGISYQNRGWDDPHLVGYMESHDEERLMYKNLTYGNSNETYDVTNLQTALQRVEAAATFFFTVPGPKMLFQWGELGYDYSINRCIDGTIDNGCRLSPKPLGWNYYEVSGRYRLYRIFSELIKLRTQSNLFETDDFSLNVTAMRKSIHLNSAEMNATIIGNFGISSGDITPSFQHTGTWYEYFTGDSIEVTDVDEIINLDPGEYRLYIDVQLEIPDIPSSINTMQPDESDFIIYPNPSNGEISLYINQPGTFDIELFNLTGSLVYRDKFISEGNKTIVVNLNNETPVQPGLYLYKIYNQEVTLQGKIIIQ
ncbi:MAG: T9SS type A sorting domain-containing protein [Bacteroidales bacterium]|nr:T9SS type A sorting domain-containing protein [Bacteroidales bacterium]